MRIRGMSEREIGMLFAAVLVGRMHIVQMNPFAVGFFMAICYEKIPKFFYIVALAIGLFQGYGPVEMTKYVLMFLICTGITGFVEKRYRVPVIVYSILGAGVVYLVEYFWNRQRVMVETDWLLLLMESLLAGVFTQVLSVGIHYLLGAKRTVYAGNEELISIMVLASLIIFGMPFQNAQTFDVMGMFLSFSILFAGYRYGAGVGSLAGAISGLFFLAQEEGIEMLGILALLGMGAGVFRELGKLVSAVTFLGLYLLCGVYFYSELLSVGKLRALVVAGILFLVLPRHFTQRVDALTLEEENVLFGLDQMERQVKCRLDRFAESFFHLSQTFQKLSRQRQCMEEQDMEQILQQVNETVCIHCEKANRCLGFTRHHKYQTASCILPAARENGYISEEDFPVNFANKCDYLDQYVMETNQALRFVCNNVQWQNRLAESREAIGEQFRDIGYLMREFARQLYGDKQLELDEKGNLSVVLKRNQILARKMELIENNDHFQELHMMVKSRKRTCVTTRELAKCVSGVLEKPFVPAQNSRNVLPKEYEKVVLVEDTKFKTITGMARRSKDGERVSGDNYSFLKLDNGELVMTLSDGMGSGEYASLESVSVVELLESFLEAGVGERTAIHLINSVFVLQSEEQNLSTLDMVVLHLHTGVCEFIKMGAAAAFIKHRDGVESIVSTSLPMGVFAKAEYENVSKKMEDGDYIILLSDGVLDTALGNNQEGYFRNIIGGLEMNNPKELADAILQQAIANNDGEIVDDMTVLVTGVWIK